VLRERLVFYPLYWIGQLSDNSSIQFSYIVQDSYVCTVQYGIVVLKSM